MQAPHLLESTVSASLVDSLRARVTIQHPRRDIEVVAAILCLTSPVLGELIDGTISSIDAGGEAHVTVAIADCSLKSILAYIACAEHCAATRHHLPCFRTLRREALVSKAMLAMPLIHRYAASGILAAVQLAARQDPITVLALLERRLYFRLAPVYETLAITMANGATRWVTDVRAIVSIRDARSDTPMSSFGRRFVRRVVHERHPTERQAKTKAAMALLQAMAKEDETAVCREGASAGDEAELMCSTAGLVAPLAEEAEEYDRLLGLAADARMRGDVEGDRRQMVAALSLASLRADLGSLQVLGTGSTRKCHLCYVTWATC